MVKSATAPAPAIASAPVAATTPAPAPTATAEPVVAIPEALADPVVTPPAEPTAAPLVDDASAAEIAFGSALALLGLGGVAFALSRRRKRRETADERDYAPVMTPAPEAIATPVPDRPAFDWGQSSPAPAMTQISAGGSAIERARRGPTPDNPSLSLKKRLKRATFFEQREREIAAGKAKPIDQLAGLPKKLADAAEQPRREAVPTYGRVFQPA